MQALYGYNRSELECEEDVMYCHYKYPKMLLAEFGMEKPNYWLDVAYLFVVFVALRSVTFLTLRRKLSMA